MSEPIREPGFYWIKVDSNHWEPAKWSEKGYWMVLGNNWYYYDRNMIEVGERIERKGE